MQLLKNVRLLFSGSSLRTVHTLGCQSTVIPMRLPATFSLLKNVELPPYISPLPKAPSILPPTWITPLDPIWNSVIVPLEAKNDIKNRKRKMKNHQKRKWRKAHISLIRKLEMQREKKEENKLQELFSFWRKRSEAWDLNEKMTNHLNFAHRSGFFVDILRSQGSPLYKPK
ncbi:hypothetical protein PHET_09372 [Paragonimus heterotremus]|uniref:Mitochondrial mRNA-processing protein COX24 C-terminal domain-containing protein n=1 Tax=Paragonimus heterotremus TaxID=100268 RepID=A0A8J4WU48_9TREM|nr:hypothetical protein PHET_09372 [Paragonimus heterotremus]